MVPRNNSTYSISVCRVDKNETVVSVAKIDESEEEEIELDGTDETAPADDAVIGEDEIGRSVDPGLN